MNKYNWKRADYPSRQDDWQKFKKNYSAVALDVLYFKSEYIHCLHFKAQFKL